MQGYCATTEATRLDCPRAAKSGSWSLQKYGIRDLDGCVAKCRTCARCFWVSLSVQNDDCSFYRHCSLPLQLKFNGERYRTVRVRNASTRHSSLAPVTRPAPRELVGHCPGPQPAAGDAEGDCTLAGSSGVWTASASGARDLEGCASLCRLCDRCRFVSFSADVDECRWYRSCELPLAMDPYALSYRTLQVRPLAEASVANGTAANGTTANGTAAILSFGLEARVLALALRGTSVELQPRCVLGQLGRRQRAARSEALAGRHQVAALGVSDPEARRWSPFGRGRPSKEALLQFCLDMAHPCRGCTAVACDDGGACTRHRTCEPRKGAGNATAAAVPRSAVAPPSPRAATSGKGSPRATPDGRRGARNRTLVIVLPQTRAANLTWDLFERHVLRPLRADLALAVRDDDVAVHGYNSYHQHAKYVWTFAEPAGHDWTPAYDAAYRADVAARRGDSASAAQAHDDAQMRRLALAAARRLPPPRFRGKALGRGRRGGAKQPWPEGLEWREILRIDGEMFGGVAITPQIGSCAVNLYSRWVIRQRLPSVLHEYDRVVVTRSDFAHCAAHEEMDFEHIWHPRGEEDWCDPCEPVAPNDRPATCSLPPWASPTLAAVRAPGTG